jgi:hypothetical protein
VHEWYHTYMSHQLDSDDRDVSMQRWRVQQEPAWLVEATAEWFALEQTANYGYSELSQDQRYVGAQYGAPRFVDLSQWETHEGLNAGQGWNVPGTNFDMLPHVGDVLVQESSRTAFLRTYWEARARTTEPWQTTFATVFGMEVPEFYAKVKQHMRDISP